MSQKTILVTGSDSWIGKWIAQLAHQEWWKVIVHSKTDTDELKNIHKDLEWSDKLFFDISDQETVKKEIWEYIKHHGCIDCLINNAGVKTVDIKKIEEFDGKKSLAEREVNVLWSLYCMQSVIPAMQKKWGWSIVNIASMKWIPQLSTISSITYAAAKAWVLSITRSIAKTYGKDNIRCNAISPGYIQTGRSQKWSDETKERIDWGILLSRLGTPDDIAPVALFLAWDEAKYITGENILVDWGYMLKGK